MSRATGIDLDGWQRLVDGLHEAVLVLDPSGTVRISNAAATRRFPQWAPGTPLGGMENGGMENGGMENGAEIGAGRRQDLGEGWSAWYFADVTLDRAYLQLASCTDRTAALRTIVDLAVSELADHCAVVMPCSRDRVEWWRGSTGTRVTVSRTAKHALSTVPGLGGVLDGTLPHTRLTDLGDGGWALPADFGIPGDILAVPLPPGGALVLIRRGRFSRSEVELAHRFGRHAALTLENASRQAEQARMVNVLRSSLLPAALPRMPEVRFGSSYLPAHHRAQVGGDFYDVHLREDGTATFVLGDVCGHGLEAAVHSGRVRQSLHTLLLVEQGPAQLLYLLNAALRATGSKLFTTLVVGELAPTGEGLRLTIASGGHPEPLVLRATSQVEEVVAPGPIVGILPEVHFHATTLVMKPGETLLLYSDGFTEARAAHDRRELFGDDRLKAALRDCAGLPADAVAQRIQDVVSGWLGDGDHDDMALLVIQPYRGG